MRIFFIIAALLMIAMLALFPERSVAAAAAGYGSFTESIFPSLFPFLVCVGMLRRFGFFHIRNRKNSYLSIVRKYFIGCIAGTPAGAILAFDEGNSSDVSLCSSVYAAFFNLSGPGFVIGAVGFRMLGFKKINQIIPLIAGHYGSALILITAHYLTLKMAERRKTCLRSGNYEELKSEPSVQQKNGTERISFVDSLTGAVFEAIRTMLIVCGNVVFFSVIAELIVMVIPSADIHPLVRALLKGTIEMTNGIRSISGLMIQPRIKLSVISFLISFGGISVMMQAKGVASINIAAYFISKVLLGILSSAVTYFAFPYCFSESTAVISDLSVRLAAGRIITAFEIALLCGFASSVSVLFALFTSKRRKRIFKTKTRTFEN